MYDVICVGFGPANIAVAVAFEELWPTARVKFLEKASGPLWQPAMLLDGSDVQNNPVRDLVTPRNPRSRYTFINYLHEHGRLFKHLNLPSHFPLRKEYARYVKWVAENVSADVDYDQEVTRIGLAGDGHGEGRRPVEVTTADGTVYRGRSVVVAPGRSPHIPPVFAGTESPQVFHTSQYLPGIADLSADYTGTLAVVGASQSAVEVVLDLVGRFPAARVVNVMSGFGYRLKDTSPFSEEVYFPEFVDYYFHASEEGKQRLRTQLRPTNYSAADADVVDALYLRMYEDELDERPRVSLRTNRLITAAEVSGESVTLDLTEHITGAEERLTVDRAILATGYLDIGISGRTEQLPPLLSDLAEVLGVSDDRPLTVGYDYGVVPDAAVKGIPPIYVNGLCESTHGLGDAGSFSLLALRSQAIVQSLHERLAQAAPTADLVGAAQLPGTGI
ncbi:MULTISPECIES: lysine N(6)-hydroxylase/L-ornithine N(5)-oxygenase family protein [unclassified Streptomyces]|uniref:lysine N(6)-hydroxylase/L-ornithine N(5)-oxygenase family protein n=1 Tax=unclassified Streptomyces TaxID=2593676 RepID=UPI002E2C73E5|nr:SidA/IucD/PvdA family monooxygenase [Streptomyces sp. NBC_00223]